MLGFEDTAIFHSLTHLQGSRLLNSIGLSRTMLFTDAVLRDLFELNMVHLYSGCFAKDRRRPKSLEEIVDIDLDDARITDEGAVCLGRLENAVSIDLSRTDISDCAIRELTNLKKLRSLSICNTGVSDNAILYLREMKHLSSLNMNRTKVTSMGVAKLRADLPNCRNSVSQRRIDTGYGWKEKGQARF